MKRINPITKIITIFILAFATLSFVFVQDDKETGSMITMNSKDIKWGQPPAKLPAGGQFAVLSGDPSKSGLFTARLKAPAGYKIGAHWHSMDEHVTVLSGSLMIGMGDQMNESNMTAIKQHGYVMLPAKMHHYAMFKEPTEIQIVGMGPFDMTYLNSKDDPSQVIAK
jgi:hypothetical protein